MNNAANPAGTAVPFSITLVAIVIGVILAAGLIGGIAAFLTQASEPTEEGGQRRPVPDAWLRFILLGIIAAACVPLFLSLVKSNLFNEMARPDGTIGFESVLIFTGLCLIAAFSARAFIDSVSRRVLQQVEQVRERQGEVEKKAAETSDRSKETLVKVETLEEVLDEQGAVPVTPEERSAAASRSAEPLPPIADAEERVLNAVAAKSYRTVTGITEDSDIERGDAKAILQALSKKGLVEPAVSPSGGLRWKVTAVGKAAAKSS